MRQSTTTSKTAAEIHQIGLDEVKRDETEMLAIIKKLGFADIKSFSTDLKTNPKLHPASKDALLDAYKTYIAQMQPKLPDMFGTLPKAKVEVVAIPAYIEKDQAAAYYNQPSADGKRPGPCKCEYSTTRHGALAGLCRSKCRITKEFRATICRLPSQRW